MKTKTNTWKVALRTRGSALLAVCVLALALAGCHTKPTAQHKDFFTSGSKEADQRASQRMAKSEQLEGSGEGAGEKGKKKASKSGGTNQAAVAENKLSLYDRLGSEKGLTAIVDDFTPRLLQDPRVNWQRQNVKHGLLTGNKTTVEWTNSPANVAALKKHLVQFLTSATGGPAHYEGKEMKAAHSDMGITNPEFDAAVGDIKASLDKLQVPNKEQKELLAIIESTRPQVVTKR